MIPAAMTAAILATAVAAPAQAAPQPLEWVALGDSYTAGAIDAAGPEYQTPRDGCVRTTLSYPRVVEAELAEQVHLRNVSCGNATIANIAETQQVPIGHHLPPFSTDPDHPFKAVALQLDAVTPDTDVVTVGIGGNSLGFGEIIFTCVQLGIGSKGEGTPCKDQLGSGIAARLERVSNEYEQMLTAIHGKAADARVITVGYPSIVPDDATTCRFDNLADFSTVTPGDLDWLRTSVLEPLNTAIKSRATARGDAYVDLYASSQGHSVCDKADGGNWVEGLLDTSGRFALVHPNAKGHANAAARVKEAILGQ